MGDDEPTEEIVHVNLPGAGNGLVDLAAGCTTSDPHHVEEAAAQLISISEAAALLAAEYDRTTNHTEVRDINIDGFTKSPAQEEIDVNTLPQSLFPSDDLLTNTTVAGYFYFIDAECSNCGLEEQIGIRKGFSIGRAECPRCECEEKLKRVQQPSPMDTSTALPTIQEPYTRTEGQNATGYATADHLYRPGDRHEVELPLADRQWHTEQATRRHTENLRRLELDMQAYREAMAQHQRENSHAVAALNTVGQVAGSTTGSRFTSVGQTLGMVNASGVPYGRP